MSGPAMVALATRCLDFCQHLEAQGKAFKFSLSLGNDFTYTLDTRGEATTTKVVRKKLSPSTLKRNARRKLEFQNRKANTSENDSTTPEKELISSEKKEADVPPPQHPSSPLAPSPSTGATQAVSTRLVEEVGPKVKKKKRNRAEIVDPPPRYVPPWRRGRREERGGEEREEDRRPWYEMAELEAEKARKSQS